MIKWEPLFHSPSAFNTETRTHQNCSSASCPSRIGVPLLHHEAVLHCPSLGPLSNIPAGDGKFSGRGRSSRQEMQEERRHKGVFQFIRTLVKAGTPFFKHHFPISTKKAGGGTGNRLSSTPPQPKPILGHWQHSNLPLDEGSSLPKADPPLSH